MEKKKLTKKETLKRVIEVLRGEVNNLTESEKQMLVDKLENEIALLEKKVSKVDTKKQEANDKIKTLIVETLKAIGEPATITDVANHNEELKAYSNQKLRKAYFTVNE